MALESLESQDRERMLEIFSQAKTALQCELIQRAFLARHTVEELYRFAFAMERMEDAALRQACFGALKPWSSGGTFQDRLFAEADPLRGFLVSQPDESEPSL